MRVFGQLLILALLLSMTSCLKDKCTSTTTYDVYTPVFVTPGEYKLPVELQAPRTLKEAGKIYYYKNLLFINEIRKGIHIIDNSQPSVPRPIGFVPILGNVDISIMNDKLYADAYTDLLIIDISIIEDIKLIARKEEVFKANYFIDGSNRLLSHYEKTTQTDVLDCSSQYYGNQWFMEDGVVKYNNSFGGKSLSSSSTGAPSIVGQAGSMARFMITSGYLYVLGKSEIFAMNIAGNGDVTTPIKTELPWGVETLFPYGKNLFVGAEDGMHILDLTDPLRPVIKSTFQHARACDPVVVADDIAYVTLRDGTTCRGFINQLDIIDVKNLDKPILLHSFNMQNPHGLAIANDYLYLCEGSYGLKVFMANPLSQLDKNQVFHDDKIHAWDAIALKNDLLLVIGEGGFYQYDISDPTNIKLLSSILVTK